MRARRWLAWLGQGLAIVAVFLATLALAHRNTLAAPWPLAAQRPAAADRPANIYILTSSGLYRYDAATGAQLNTPSSWGPGDPLPPPGTAFGVSARNISGFISGDNGAQDFFLILNVVLDREHILTVDRLSDLRTMRSAPIYPSPWHLDLEAAAAATGPGRAWLSTQSIALGPDGQLYVVMTSSKSPGSPLELRRQLARFDTATGRFLGNISAEPYPAFGGHVPLNIYSIFRGDDGALYWNYYERGYGVRRYEYPAGIVSDVRIAGQGYSHVVDRSGGIYFWRPTDETYVIERYDLASGARQGIVALGEVVGTPVYPPAQEVVLTRRVPAYFDVGDDGIIYVLDEAYTTSGRPIQTLKRFEGRTGRLIDTLLTADQLPHGPIIGIAVVGGQPPTDAELEVRPARVRASLSAAPGRQVAPGQLLTLTVRATNDGPGPAKDARLTLGIDPALLGVVDASFSRPSAWVSAVLSDSFSISTGGLRGGEVVTGTVRLRVRDDAPPGADLRLRLALRWSDDVRGGSGRSNEATLTVGPSADGPQPLAVSAQPRGLRFSGAAYSPGEPVALWYDAPSGRSVGLGRTRADDEGAISYDLATAGLAQGHYQLVAQGVQSGAVATATFTLP